MTLLTTVFAAVFCTVLWYQKASARELKVGILCWMFWGASLMWLGDAIFEYAELGAAYFTPAASDMLNAVVKLSSHGTLLSVYSISIRAMPMKDTMNTRNSGR